MIRSILKWCFFLLLASTVYAACCKVVMPPITLTQLSSWLGPYGLTRDYVSGDEISSNLKLAAMASEDQLFPDHGGFDWKQMEKSMLTKHKNRVRGGAASTISQQTAKNVFLWQGEGVMKYIRKVPEFYFTKIIEWIWGKKRILNVYLNVIETGPGLFGVEAAAQHYFHKPAKDLTRREAALIIACLPNPKKFIATSGDRYVEHHANWIMRQMNNLKDDPDIKALIEN
ncbi:monofunctional biosynthetic peptidoglycan transglycosylase [Rhizosphaericola mali]|uniref:Monofunctional biosynthetic peptidoglycan transglycosylase n=1 Tax=Rhizosphaericola mali TaxID=2545455 RepID=A0A5P2G0A4_9BACT|nr:monofunctional biosynthetic peptidoglycan transglycosylase [Rhizosphaericola mali]QES87549.1 monofunctional biosynthetic peptidoglycan transglycosylase [Rhizosphaericola mali]